MYHRPILSIFCNVTHCSGLNNALPPVPQIYAHPESQNVDLFGKRVFADAVSAIRDLEMQSSWVLRGP